MDALWTQTRQCLDVRPGSWTQAISMGAIAREATPG